MNNAPLRFYVDFSENPPEMQKLPGIICGKIENMALKLYTERCHYKLFPGLCMSDTRYLENMLYRNVFVKVAKDRKIKNGMTGKV